VDLLRRPPEHRYRDRVPGLARAIGRTDLEQITDEATGSYAWSASPSPDGSQIVFIAGVPPWETHLIVHTLGSGAQDTIKRNVLQPRAAWSPTGEWIAYTYFGGDTWFEHEGRVTFVNDRVALVQPDGTDHPVVTGTVGSLVFGGGGVNWSPDGEWLVAMSPFRDLRIKLIHIATGQNIPLNAATRGHYQPAWRP
jgi:Tol biopolymer transport system component